ncbi:MAG TPA: protein kinase [Gemmatimonadales bacterium]|nr:protein kinase [Gemmatimonadales bacterium]
MSDPSTRLTTALSDRYRIERELGSGGMATVYLAQDLRHDRHVALKVLRPELAAVLGAERFLHEIKTTANLQHPHILPLHDSGEVDGTVFYVMPYVEGESLRDRLNREKQLPVDDAVRIGREVAGALDYAHRHGVIHRDIKPENILLHDGQALVADFGIALAVSSAGGSRMTETGMSLGTPHYMSPEQAMGEREITARSDVYALGCVVYEMLTGEPPFTGATAQAIVARVLTEHPRPLISQRHTIPAHVEQAVLTALEKLPADRFSTAAQFSEALAGRAPTISGRATAATPAALGAGRRWQPLAGWVAAGLAILLAAFGWLRRSPSPPVTRDFVTLSDSVGLLVDQVPVLAISRDGSHIAFIEENAGGRLWVRSRDDLHARLLPETQGARMPAFSPDGQWIAFVTGTKLRKVRTDGGGAITLADSASSIFGGLAWLDDGTLVYTDQTLGLRRMNQAGGASTPLVTTAQMSGRAAAMADPLPGARGVFVTLCNSNCITQELAVVDLKSGKFTTLVPNATRAWYLPTGHILYVRRDGVAMAAPFDLRSLKLTGTASPVLENIEVLNSSSVQLGVSESGTLLYVQGAGVGSLDRTMVRVDRSGRVSRIDSAFVGRFNSFALSRDGKRVAVGAASGDGFDIWIKELDHGPFTRLTFSGQGRRPVWSPDGSEVAYIRDTLSGGNVYAHRSDGSGQDRLLASLDRPIQSADWSRDGQWLLMRTDDAAEGHGDIVGKRTSGDTAAVPLAATQFEELHPSLSRDGHWMAYSSNESGQYEVYVRPFPNAASGRWQVSIGGGGAPRWSPDGSELYFLNGNQLIAARIVTAPTFAVAQRTPLFSVADYDIDFYHQSFEVTPDGRSFLFLASTDRLAHRANTGRLVLVSNWFAELKTRLGH